MDAMSCVGGLLERQTAVWFFQDVDRRRKFKGWARTWMSHHQIPRLDGDQAERCDGNLPFVGRLATVIDDGLLGRTGFVEGEVLFSAVAQTVGFGPGRLKMLYLSTGVD